MSKDPLGFIGRANAMSLMLITPEFYRIRRLRGKEAGKIDYAKTNFHMKPEFKTIDGSKIRIAKSEHKSAPTILFLSPLPQSILCYDAVWSLLSETANLVAADLPGFGRSEGGKEYMSFEAQSAFLERFINTQGLKDVHIVCLLYTSPSPRDLSTSRMPSSA